jgi:hypothetical protein
MKTVCKNLLAALALCVAPLPSFSGNNAESQTPTVRILAVGNSFSEDAIDQYFHELCEAAGKRVIIGNLYIGGCSLERHLLNARTDSAAYRFRRIGHDGVTITANPVTLSSALQSDDWNYVSFQQASPLSGKYGSYADLKPLIAYADNVTQGRPTYMWQQTWAYSPTSTHGAFPTYNSDQKVMYDSIMSATRRVMTDYPSLKVLIPTGTAVQTARIASGNYDLTRDGYHLDRLTGRYIAACTWFEAIFGESVIGNPYHPAGMTDEQARMAQEAAHSACEAMK